MAPADISGAATVQRRDKMAKDSSQGFKWCGSSAAFHIESLPHATTAACARHTTSPPDWRDSPPSVTHRPVARRRNTVAGCTAGFIPVLALHPLDVVKTRLQGGSAHKHVRCPRCQQSAAWQPHQYVVSTTIRVRHCPDPAAAAVGAPLPNTALSEVYMPASGCCMATGCSPGRCAGGAAAVPRGGRRGGQHRTAGGLAVAVCRADAGTHWRR